MLPFTASPRLTNDLDIFLQDDSLGAAPMPAPMPSPHVPLGFLLLAATSGPTASPGSQTAPRIEAGGQSVSPGNQTVSLGSQTDPGTKAGDPTGGQTAPVQRLAIGPQPHVVRPPGLAQLLQRSGVLALPTALLTSPSDFTGATSIASTSAVTSNEGRTSSSSDQHSSDDHTGEAGLPTSNQQTHIVGHFGVDLVTSAHLRPCHPHRPVLASCHGRRI
jgi:hypothetical protein